MPSSLIGGSKYFRLGNRAWTDTVEAAAANTAVADAATEGVLAPITMVNRLLHWWCGDYMSSVMVSTDTASLYPLIS